MSSPDTSEFPRLTAYLDVHDQAGEFVYGLTTQDVKCLENGAEVPVEELQEEKPGVQFVLAIAPGSTLSNRDASGTSRYKYLLQGMFQGTWAFQAPDGDDFSLVTVGGPQLTHASDPSALRGALESYQPTDPKATPNLEVLATALQLVSDPTPRPGMERAILFITPPQPAEISLGLQSIVESANKQNIHIFVWLVSSQDTFEAPEIGLLRDLASQTQADYFAFSQDEAVPDLENLLEPLRYVYLLGYDSQASKTGAQQVVAQVSIGGQLVDAQPQSFELNLASPTVVILDLPAAIARNFQNQPTPAADQSSSDLQPANQALDIRVNFPDGHVRPLANTKLIVDGAVVAEDTSAPFEQLVWDLRAYTQEGTHTVRVEATDILGWMGQSNEMPVKITVPSSAQEVVAVVSQNRLLVVGLTVLTSASILILVLILGGRIRPKPYPGQARSFISLAEKFEPRGYWQRLRQMKDPLTQPVKVNSAATERGGSTRKGWLGRLPWVKQKAPVVIARAYLEPLAGSNEPTLPVRLQISEDTVILGSDPQKASLVIQHASVEGIHARIIQEGQAFRISDAGSVAGTWVNYEQVSTAGANLKHADLIYLGRVGFRFRLPNPGAPPKVTVTPMEPGQ